MNSNSKFIEIEEEKRVLVQKINNAIRNYRIRKLAVLDEIADLSRWMTRNDDELDMVANWRERIRVLREEVEFCDRQIKAYTENDNKMKIIPDRLL